MVKREATKVIAVRIPESAAIVLKKEARRRRLRMSDYLRRVLGAEVESAEARIALLEGASDCIKTTGTQSGRGSVEESIPVASVGFTSEEYVGDSESEDELVGERITQSEAGGTSPSLPSIPTVGKKAKGQRGSARNRKKRKGRRS